MARDWTAFQAEVAARVPELAADLLGQPSARSRHEWRWGRRGSLSLVMAGAKAGQWYDHERGEGGGFRDLVARELGTDRDGALDWLDGRIGDLPVPRSGAKRKGSRPLPAQAPAAEAPADDRAERAGRARNTAAAIWGLAQPASPDHAYLRRKSVGPHGLRETSAGKLVVPLSDVDGALHSLEFITAEGQKRYLAGAAKRCHLCTIGDAPSAEEPILICEGWATGASLHEATGHTELAAMDAGNMGPVAETVRAKFADADIVLVADNDAMTDRQDNPGVAAATKAARAISGRLAVPPVPGDANDLAEAQGLAAAMVAAAARLPEPVRPTANRCSPRTRRAPNWSANSRALWPMCRSIGAQSRRGKGLPTRLSTRSISIASPWCHRCSSCPSMSASARPAARGRRSPSSSPGAVSAGAR